MDKEEYKSNRVLQNISWFIVGKILQSLVGFVISIYTTRYLGPKNYGFINYAISVVSFVMPFAELGFSFVLVKELSSNEDEGQVMGTSIRLSIISSFICFLIVNFYFVSTNSGEKTALIVNFIYSFRVLLVGLELINYWYQKHLLSKYWSLIGLMASGVIALYKLYILMTGKSIYWFTCINIIDYLVIVVLAFFFYRRLGGKRFSYSKTLAKDLFTRVPYYIIASLTVSIFSNTDKFMIKHILGEYYVGIYSLAFSFVGYSSFIFVAIIDSFRPPIMIAKSQDNMPIFSKRISYLYSLVFYLALLQAVILSIFGPWFIVKLYGTEFSPSSDILVVIVWYTIFSYMGAVNGIWIVANNKQKYLLYQNLIGALLNISLNFLLIEKFGVIGAAYATLLTQFVSNFIVYLMIPDLRDCFFLILKGFDVRILCKIRSIL